jgi:epoxyqueuosine reductase
MLIHPRIGSFLFLGALLKDLDLVPDEPFETDHCGSCTRCLDACPTGALLEPRVLDSRLCISYLTIELRTEIPAALRERMGQLVYGCDVCQDVCPWNVKFSRVLPHESPFANRAALGRKDARTLARELIAMTPDDFATAFRGSPMKRAKLGGLKRNAAVVLGNIGHPDDADLLSVAASDAEPLVRDHAVWALSRLRT